MASLFWGVGIPIPCMKPTTRNMALGVMVSRSMMTSPSWVPPRIRSHTLITVFPVLAAVSVSTSSTTTRYRPSGTLALLVSL